MTGWLAAVALATGAIAGPGATPTASGVGTAPALAARTVAPAPADRWAGEDKLQHAALSFAATQLGYGAARLSLDPGPALAAAAGAAVAAAVGKELVDRGHGTGFSTRDLLWDAAGIAVGVLVADRIR